MSTMRYIQIPAPEAVVGDQGPKLYTYFDLLDQFVWHRPEWRKDEAWFSAWERLNQAHEEAKEKDTRYVPVSGEDYEKFVPLATLRDVQLGGPNVKPIVRLTRCILFASTTKPEDVEGQRAAQPEPNLAGKVAQAS